VDVKSSEQLFLSFNLGDCYVSAVVFKHILFKETPLIPLAFVSFTTIGSSVVFMRPSSIFLKTAVPKIMKNKIPIVIDREPGLKNYASRLSHSYMLESFTW